jgi:hypothetical protein
MGHYMPAKSHLMDSKVRELLMHIPWPIYLVIVVAIAAAIFLRNTLKLRKQFGNHADVEEIRSRDPGAKVFALWPKKNRSR